jgi:hypothetical protein
MGFVSSLTRAARDASNECRKIASERHNLRKQNILRKNRELLEDYTSENEAVFKAKIYANLLSSAISPRDLTLEPTFYRYPGSRKYPDLVYCSEGLLWNGIGMDKSEDYIIEVKVAPLLKKDGELRKGPYGCGGIREDYRKLLGAWKRHGGKVRPILVVAFTNAWFPDKFQMSKSDEVVQNCLEKGGRKIRFLISDDLPDQDLPPGIGIVVC